MTYIVRFDATGEDAEVILAILKRAKALYKKLWRFPLPDPMSLHMDITACHLNGCPLKLQKLLEADDFNFAHDVFGIQRHINRRTGKLEDCFLPRSYDREAAHAPV